MFVSDQVCGGNVDFFESASTELYNYRTIYSRNYVVVKMYNLFRLESTQSSRCCCR